MYVFEYYSGVHWAYTINLLSKMFVDNRITRINQPCNQSDVRNAPTDGIRCDRVMLLLLLLLLEMIVGMDCWGQMGRARRL